MNEAETRAEYIDPALKTEGWGVVEGSRIRRDRFAAVPFEDKGGSHPSRWNLGREPSRRPRILFLADRNILAN